MHTHTETHEYIHAYTLAGILARTHARTHARTLSHTQTHEYTWQRNSAVKPAAASRQHKTPAHLAPTTKNAGNAGRKSAQKTPGPGKKDGSAVSGPP